MPATFIPLLSNKDWQEPLILVYAAILAYSLESAVILSVATGKKL